MKLYDLAFSPYAARIRMVIRLKNLPVEILPPPVPLRSDEFFSRYPLGKIPILELDDGTCLVESWVIMEYLEDVYPQTSLRPADPVAAAHARTLGRIADLHLGPAMFPLFGELRAPGGDATKVQGHIAATMVELNKLGRMLDNMPDHRTRSIDIGDVALATTMFYVNTLPPLHGAPSPANDNAAVARWWMRVSRDAAIARTLAEMDAGLRGFLRKL